MTAGQSDMRSESPHIGNDRRILYPAGIIVLAGIASVSFSNFLLFHALAEVFSIIIACSLFIVVWNTRHVANNNYMLFLGIAYLFVGLLDLTHTLAYKGMNIFVGYGANLPTQLWIGARYLESISLAIAPVFFACRLNTRVAFGVFLGLCSLIFATLFIWPIFPDCFVEGSGLTAFKKISEYVISVILLGSIVILHRRRECLQDSIFQLIVVSIVLTIFSEIAFTFYVSVYGASNLVGHLFKIVSFFLIYQAVIVATLTTPYQSLFREVVEKEKAKERVIGELEDALQQVKLLEGFLPICACCKHIRDDKGYWTQIEQYISERSDVQFSHGLCPKCAKEFYPDVFPEDDSKE